jgi:hypothetical protein
MSALPTAVLGVPDNLTNIDADERRWRIGHVAELAEGPLRCSSVFLRVEEPEGMLDDVTLEELREDVRRKRGPSASG